MKILSRSIYRDTNLTFASLSKSTDLRSIKLYEEVMAHTLEMGLNYADQNLSGGLSQCLQI